MFNNNKIRQFLNNINYDFLSFWKKDRKEVAIEMMADEESVNILGGIYRKNSGLFNQADTIINFLYENGNYPKINFKVDDQQKLKEWGKVLLNTYHSFLLDCLSVLEENEFEEKLKKQ